MKKKFLIVESAGDEATLKAILMYMKHLDTINVNNTDVEMIDFEKKSIDEEEPTGLKNTLKSVFSKVVKGGYDKIGIIWDIDDFHVDKPYPQTQDRKQYRVSQMNRAIDLAIGELISKYTIFFETKLTDTNQFVSLKINDIDISIACYFVNYQGKGELEDLLKAIKSEPSPIADCVVESLPHCLSKKEGEKQATEKDKVKIWKEFYVRYDTLPDNNFPKPNKQRSEALTKWENVMEKRPYIFDFGKDEVVELKELKEFLAKLVE
jgi:hypothetical protein